LPVKDTFLRAELEMVGAVIDPHATTDCFTRHTALLRGYGSHAVPSRSVMQSAQMAMVCLLREDPVADKPPQWLSDIGFAGGRLIDSSTLKFPSGRSLDNIEKLRIWGSNDIHGMQYFASCILPDCRADEASRRLWRTTGTQHVFNTDYAPFAVVHQLSGESRVEYHHIPCPSVLSNIVSRGFQYSTREALVLVTRAHSTISVGGKETIAHFVWMKSIRHPDLPAEGQGYDGIAPAASMMKSYAKNKHMESTAAVQGVAGSTPRAIVRLRAFVFYEDPTTQSTVCCCFGHEDSSGGLAETFGKAGHYLSFGFAAGGVHETASFQMSRMAHILPTSGEEYLDELFGRGPFSTKVNASEIFHTRHGGV